MTQALRSYLLAIVAVSLLTAILLGLLPKGGVRRAAGLTCAMALAVVVLRPVAALDGESLARAIARLEMESEQLRTGVDLSSALALSDSVICLTSPIRRSRIAF